MALTNETWELVHNDKKSKQKTQTKKKLKAREEDDGAADAVVFGDLQVIQVGDQSIEVQDGKFLYDVTVGVAVSNVAVRGIPKTRGVSVSINNQVTQRGSFSADVPLLVGFNTTSIVAEGLAGTKQYFVVIVRGNNPSFLTSLIINEDRAGFFPGKLNYTILIPNQATRTIVAPYVAFPDKMDIAVNGNLVDNASQTVVPTPLNVDIPFIEVTVTMKPDSRFSGSHTYTITLEREDPPNEISFCRIFPGIGMGRLGNSPDDYFIGPEAPGFSRSQEDPKNPPDQPFVYKDNRGRIKRQAARFRVYAYRRDQQDLLNPYDAKPFRELTISDGDVETIQWTVTVANKKASWFTFNGAYDQEHNLRNASVEDRISLEITPRPISISGSNTNNSDEDDAKTRLRYQFNDGQFLGNRVRLGEVKTDDKGRLLVLGGFGATRRTAQGDVLMHYANNDFWHDDTSDGTIECVVTLKDGTILKEKDVLSAHVIIAPPKYAPEIIPVVPLYTVMKEVAESINMLPPPPKDCVYYRDIHPILLSGISYDFVNDLANQGHRNGITKLTTPDLALELADRDHSGPRTFNFFSDVEIARMNASSVIRQHIFSKFRVPPALSDDKTLLKQANPAFMPRMSGPGGAAVEGVPLNWFSVTEGQYQKLQMWSEGDFTLGEKTVNVPFLEDHDVEIVDEKEGEAHVPRVIPIEEQPKALDFSTLVRCIGGPYFPGIEITYIALAPDTYMDAFRFSTKLIQAGDATKFMAVPWQADFYECRLTWWPSHRPDDVIPEEEYNKVGPKEAVGPDLPRVQWERGLRLNIAFAAEALGDSTQVWAGDMDMVDDWQKLGFVVPRPAKGGTEVQIETERDPNFSPDPNVNHPGQQ